MKLAHLLALFLGVLPVQPACAQRDAELLQAIERVESGGDAAAVGDGGQAVGILQIHPIMVAEVNRIRPKDTPEFTLSDRLDPAKSEAMFWIYVDRHCRGGSREKIARCWNGGPRGDRKRSTVQYWSKVRKRLIGSESCN